MFDKLNPYKASIKNRYHLSKPGSKRCTYHITLDLGSSGLKYCVGDSVGIFCKNSAEVVQLTIAAMKAKGDELVFGRNALSAMPLLDFLTMKANIGQVSRKLIQEIALKQTNLEKKGNLEKLLTDAHHDALKAYLEQRELWDLLNEHEEVTFSPQELCSLLMPLLPRLYSIASSQDVAGNEIDLTVSHLIYHTNGYERRGACTDYLCSSAPLNDPSIPIYIQPHHGFTLPEDASKPIIMVGPGTGVAPFRAFLQQRMYDNAEGQNWLFFGEWNRAYDFFYEEYWNELPNLRVTTAFSRDQEHKIYVQHRLLENSQEVYNWLERGAYFYVCGDAQRMAKDVDAALLSIIQKERNCDIEVSKKMVKQLRNEKRYLRDIY